MIRHFFTIAYRNILRFKFQFLMNLTGLSVGLACVMLIYLWIDDEYRVDKFHINGPRLYQVIKNNTEPDGIDTGEDTPPQLARTLKEDMPEIEAAVAVFPPEDHSFKGILSIGEQYTKASSKFAEQNFFNVFSFPLIEGDEDKVLTDPYHIVISKTTALKLFNSTKNVVGKSLQWHGDWHKGDFVIAGVFDDLPGGTTMHFDVIFSYQHLREKSPKMFNWHNNTSNTFVLLHQGTDVELFNQKLAGYLKSKSAESTATLFTRKFTDRYLYSQFENGVQTGGRIEYVKIFSLIAVFILVIACINYVNLATARATTRSKEVGVKKTFGAPRKTLIQQYLCESLAITLCATLVSVLLVDLALPAFNKLTGKTIVAHLSFNTAIPFIVLTIMTGLIAGIYPALFLSGFHPARILKGSALSYSTGQGPRTKWASNTLVFLQFTISVVLIVCVIVVQNQMTYVQSRNLGFDKENILTFSSEGKLADSTETFLSGIKQIPGVINASVIDGDLVSLHSGTTAVDWEGKEAGQDVDFELLRAGYDLIETLGITVKEGRDFSPEFTNESSSVIFNEAAIESMGITDPVGKTVKVWGQDKRIIGVVRNFHFESLYEQVKPFFFLLSDKGNNNILVRVRAGTEPRTLEALGEYYATFNQGLPFDFRFLDQDIDARYAAENRVAVLSKYFAGLAIFLSCLGLYGLAAFSAEQRYKEIGIRKVLGSSEGAIIMLLSKDFMLLLIMAIAVALPMSYIINQQWLEGFAYRIPLQWSYFFVAGMAALLISWCTVGAHAIRAARNNPVKSLRSE